MTGIILYVALAVLVQFALQIPPDTRAVFLRRGGASYSPPSPQPLNVDAVLAAIAPKLGYENIGYFKFFSEERAPKELEDHVSTSNSISYSAFEVLMASVPASVYVYVVG